MTKNVNSIYYLLSNLAYEFDINHQCLKNVLVVSIQHILSTTAETFTLLKEYGLSDAVIGGKKYSTHFKSAEQIKELGFNYIPDSLQLGYGHFDEAMQEVVHKVWLKALDFMSKKQYDLVIILDDGADLLRTTPGTLFADDENLAIKKPKSVIGIEQTRAGINHPSFSGLPFPIVNVAGSYIKELLEYPHVAELITENIEKCITYLQEQEQRSDSDIIIGIIGYGVMGKAITKKLLNRGLKVIVYDSNTIVDSEKENEAIFFDDSAVLISNSNILVSCTGNDITSISKNFSALLYSRNDKWLISTGSKDSEFNSLLRNLQEQTKSYGCIPDPFKDVTMKNYMSAKIHIIRGGFPVNFQNNAHSVLPKYIWPTRAALFLSCFFAKDLGQFDFNKWGKSVNMFMLPASIQRIILLKYLTENPEDNTVGFLKQYTEKELDDLILSNSGGKIFEGTKQLS